MSAYPNAAARWTVDDGDAVPSPCISVCELDGEGVCIGCLRTAAEIAGWPAMDPAAQRRLLSLLEARRRQPGLPAVSFQEIE
jgi:predicted Fe-S protein YdhL (DUF1289 family)